MERTTKNHRNGQYVSDTDRIRRAKTLIIRVWRERLCPMASTDIWRAADTMMKLYEPPAAAEHARSRAIALLHHGDLPGFFEWAQIGVAILSLSIEKPSANDVMN
jgi:hypothetical protein